MKSNPNIERMNRRWAWLSDWAGRISSWAWSKQRCTTCGGLMDGPPCHGRAS